MKGFTLIELMIYFGVGTVMLSSLITLSLMIEKEITMNDLSIKEEKTADLIFKTYEESIKQNSSIIFICDKNGARVIYPGSSVEHQIGEISSKNCLLAQTLSFSLIKNNFLFDITT